MDWTITPATAAERRGALELVLRAVADSVSEANGQADDLMESCEQGETSLEGLFVARQDSEIVGVGLVILQADGTAHVWPPAVSDIHSCDPATAEAIRHRIGEFCVNWLSRSRARLAQCVTPVDRVDCHQFLQSIGFESLTELLCLQHQLVDIPHAPFPDDCETTGYSEDLAGRFESVMRETYASSQDCQGLQGRRTAAECLAAHRLSGSYDPALWQIFHVGGEDMGIMLCADHRDQRTWELLYLGVTPKFRKQGFGMALVSDALWHARVSGVETALVAVDASNIAAKSLYEMCGFQERFRKQIHIWTNGLEANSESTGCAQAKSLDDTF
jgi:GNAT superfamily N-acetyltransferase